MTFHPKPYPGIQLNKKHRLAKGLTGCWMMNEHSGNVVFDSSVNTIHGTNSGANWIPDGLNFAGAEYVSLSKVPIGDLDTYTISLRFNGIGGAGTIMYGEGFSGDNEWAMFVGIAANDPWGAWFTVKENNVWKAEILGTTTVNDGWHTISLSQKNRSYRTMYVDGIPEVVEETAIGDMSILDTATIGALERLAVASFYIGDIAYVHTHNRGFSDADAKKYNRDPHGMFERSMIPTSMCYTAPAEAIMNLFQGPNIGADLFNGALL